jgi:hypothetical protein
MTEAEPASETLCRYFYKLLVCVWLCVIYIGILPPPPLRVAVSLISHLGFFWLLVFRGGCGGASALVCMQFLCFLDFLGAVKCAVAGSLIATCVWLASRVCVCVRPGKLVCG